jgi:hypothetical protein
LVQMPMKHWSQDNTPANPVEPFPPFFPSRPPPFGNWQLAIGILFTPPLPPSADSAAEGSPAPAHRRAPAPPPADAPPPTSAPPRCPPTRPPNLPSIRLLDRPQRRPKDVVVWFFTRQLQPLGTLAQEFSQTPSEPHNVMGLAFPNHQNAPSQRPKLPYGPAITFAVTVEFGQPILGPALRDVG